MRYTVVDKRRIAQYNVKKRPLVAISACLTGEKVRHDGRDAEFPTTSNNWVHFLELLPMCPEIDIGMTIPRGETKLVRKNEQHSLVDSITNHDYTEKMLDYAQMQVDLLSEAGICGFIFKRGSASCGLVNVPVYVQAKESNSVNGRGLFAMVFTTLNPQIPVIEEQQLSDPIQVEQYLARVQFYQEWLDCGKIGWTFDKIRQFHRENRYFFLSRLPQLVQSLEKLINKLEKTSTHPQTIALEYMIKAQKGLNVVSKKGQVANTMELILSKFSNHLTNEEMQKVAEQIRGFRSGVVSRNAPLKILNDYRNRYAMNDKSVDRFISSVPLEIYFDM